MGFEGIQKEILPQKAGASTPVQRTNPRSLPHSLTIIGTKTVTQPPINQDLTPCFT